MFRIEIEDSLVRLTQLLEDEVDPEAVVSFTVPKAKFDQFMSAVEAAGWKPPKKTRKVSTGSVDGFDRFKEIYPCQEVMYGAQKLWKSMNLSSEADAIIAHVERMKSSENWTANGGMYVPYPTRYLSEKRWLNDRNGDNLGNVL